MSVTLPEITGIRAFDHEGLKELLESKGLPSFRAGQLESWLYGKGAGSYEEMTNLPKAMRENLANAYPLHNAEVAERLVSKDGSRKYLLRYSDGALAEAVGIPSKQRLTVCLSSQAGCPMGCLFCATGREGFTRNLAPGEIVEQAVFVSNDFGLRVSHVVMMGQGEPFLNFDASIGAARFLNSKSGMGVGARHITLSTCGVIPGIRRFSSISEQFTLAVSLHSAIQETRDVLMPGVRQYSLESLRRSIESYVEKTGRRPTYEYAMIADVNDGEEDLAALIAFCRRSLCHVNLIALNKIPGSPYSPSDPKRIRHFSTELTVVGVETTVRKSRGADIQGACGQLSSRPR